MIGSDVVGAEGERELVGPALDKPFNHIDQRIGLLAGAARLLIARRDVDGHERCVETARGGARIIEVAAYRLTGDVLPEMIEAIWDIDVSVNNDELLSELIGAVAQLGIRACALGAYTSGDGCHDDYDQENGKYSEGHGGS